MKRIKRQTLTLASADQASAAGLAAAQQPSSTFILTAAAAAISPARRVQATTAGADAGKTVVLVGRDQYGNAVTETITLVSTGAVLSAYEYSVLTSATISATPAANVSLGWDGVYYTKWAPTDRYGSNGWAFAVTLNGYANITYDVQHIFKEDLLIGGYTHTANADEVFTHSSVAAQTTNKDGNYAFPPRAIRAKVTLGGAPGAGGPFTLEIHPATTLTPGPCPR